MCLFAILDKFANSLDDVTSEISLYFMHFRMLFALVCHFFDLLTVSSQQNILFSSVPVNKCYIFGQNAFTQCVISNSKYKRVLITLFLL